MSRSLWISALCVLCLIALFLFLALGRFKA